MRLTSTPAAKTVTSSSLFSEQSVPSCQRAHYDFPTGSSGAGPIASGLGLRN